MFQLDVAFPFSGSCVGLKMNGFMYSFVYNYFEILVIQCELLYIAPKSSFITDYFD